MLTPVNVVLNKKEQTIVFRRDGSSITVPQGHQMKLDLKEILGIKSAEINLVFENKTTEEIEAIKKDKRSLQAFYYFLNFNIGSWVKVEEVNDLNFYEVVLN